MEDQDRTNNKKELSKKDELDLVLLIKTLWDSRITIIRSIIIFAILGILLALFSKKEYTASSILVPQIGNTSTQLGGLSSLASLAGVNMDMNTETNTISPVLYPEIISSIQFQIEIMNSEFFFEEAEERMSLFDYYFNVYNPGLFGIIKKYTFGLPGLILDAVRGEKTVPENNSDSKVIRINKEQEEVLDFIDEGLSLDVNEEDGYLTLISRFHQAFLSAQVAKNAQQRLQEYVIRYKIEKAEAQMKFVEERYEEKKQEFEIAQSRLASFRDANKNISSEIMRTQEERLQNEYQLAFDIYSELSKQLEQAKIKVKEETPVFSIIEEVSIPNKETKPNRSLILIVWVFMGLFFGIFWILGKNQFTNLKIRWNTLNKTENEK